MHSQTPVNGKKVPLSLLLVTIIGGPHMKYPCSSVIVALIFVMGCTTTESARRTPKAPSPMNGTVVRGSGSGMSVNINMTHSGWGIASGLALADKVAEPGSDYYIEPIMHESALKPSEDLGKASAYRLSFTCQPVSPQAMAVNLVGKRVRIRTLYVLRGAGKSVITREFQLKNQRSGTFSTDVVIRDVQGRLETDALLFVVPNDDTPMDGVVYCAMTDMEDGFKSPAPKSNIIAIRVSR